MHYLVLYWLLFAVVAVSVAGNPVALPGRPKCLAEGEGCWKEKRAAALEEPRCEEGEGCWKEKRVAGPETTLDTDLV